MKKQKTFKMIFQTYFYVTEKVGTTIKKMKPNTLISNASGQLNAKKWSVANHWWTKREYTRFAHS